MEVSWIIELNLRTLLKKGHLKTLEFLGYKINADVVISNLVFDKDEINIGDLLEFEFDLHSNDNCNVVIDYKVIFPSVSSVVPKKIYKLKDITVQKGETYKIKGRQRFRHMSTRQMRKGTHTIMFQLNGKVVLEKTFILN